MENKVAFITGASRGIGAETAVALARAGYQVGITARTLAEGESHDHAGNSAPLPGSLQSTAAAVRAAGSEALCLRADLLETSSLVTAVEQTIKQFGHIDVVFNNAIYQGPGNQDLLLDLSTENLQAIYRGNVFTPLAIVQAALPAMLTRNTGVIINMVSYTAFNDPPAPASKGGWGFAYPSSKAALARMAGSLRAEHPQSGLRFLNLEPGTVITELMKSAGIDAEVLKRYKPCSAAAIAALVVWLANNDPPAEQLQDGIVRGPALAKKLGLLDLPSLLET